MAEENEAAPGEVEPFEKTSEDDIKINRYVSNPSRGRGFSPRGPRYVQRTHEPTIDCVVSSLYSSGEYRSRVPLPDYQI